MKRATPEDVRFICECAAKRRALRDELLKLTYEKIAKHTGLSKTHVQRILHGLAHKKLQRAMRDEARALHDKENKGQVANT